MKTLTVKLTNDSLRSLERKAADLGRPKSALAREFIVQSLDQQPASLAGKLKGLRDVLHSKAGSRTGTRGYLKGFGRD